MLQLYNILETQKTQKGLINLERKIPCKTFRNIQYVIVVQYCPQNINSAYMDIRVKQWKARAAIGCYLLSSENILDKSEMDETSS